MRNVVCSQARWRSTLPVATIIDHLQSSFPKGTADVFVLDGNRMTDYPGLFENFQKELKFPDYFCHNLNAFLECITDMDWLIRDSYWVLIEHSKNLLRNRPEDIGWFLDICQKVSIEWSQPIALGESWDRPAKPFVFIFLFSKEKQASDEGFASLPVLDERLLAQNGSVPLPIAPDCLQALFGFGLASPRRQAGGVSLPRRNSNAFAKTNLFPFSTSHPPTRVGGSPRFAKLPLPHSWGGGARKGGGEVPEPAKLQNQSV